MDILSISKKEKEAVVRLSSDELVKLANVLYHAKDSDKNNLYYKLYGEVMLARDLSQYGHIDGYCLAKIVECRESINK